MKITKMLGLAMVAALMTVAFAGAGTATAGHEAGHTGKHSVLCIDETIQTEQVEPNDISVCESKKEAIKAATLQGYDQPEEGHLVVFSDGTEIECQTSTFQAAVKSEGSSPEQQVKGEVTKMELGGENPTADCEVRNSICKDVEDTRYKGEGTIQFEWERQTAPQGHAQFEESATEWEFQDCTFFQVAIVCTYGGNEGEEANGSLFSPTEPDQAQLKMEEAKVELVDNQSNASCPESGLETGGYQLQADEVVTQNQEIVGNQRDVWLAKHQQ